MSVIRAFFGAIGAFFGSIFGGVLLFVILVAGSIFLFAYLDDDGYSNYRLTPEERALYLPSSEEDEEDLSAADLSLEDDSSLGFDNLQDLFGNPWETVDDPAPVYSKYNRQEVVRYGADVADKPYTPVWHRGYTSIYERNLYDYLQEAGDIYDSESSPDGSGISDSSDSVPFEIPYGLELNSAELGGDPALMRRNIEADIMYQSNLDAIEAHRAGGGTDDIPEDVLDSLRETLAMYEATARDAYISGMQSDTQAVYARITAVQLRRFLGIPV